MIISFFGHSDFYADINENLIVEIVEKISRGQEVDFYLGGYGKFDDFAYRCAVSYKRKHPNKTKVIFVTPYIYDGYGKLEENKDKYDEIIYPELEKVPRKFAIAKRNEWIIEKAQIIFAYVIRNYGGASKSLAYAKKRGKTIIDISSKENLKLQSFKN